MKFSKLFAKPSKEVGLDYKVDSHRLLTQAGFIRESSAGRYYLLPLGIRVQHKLIEVIRSEMDKRGAQEIITPVLHSLDLWQETNRDQAAGFELMQVEDRRGARFVLGGTAEEMVVDLIRKFNISYRDLPLNLYQFSMKFRDELRARGGLLRVREFIMKDAYSFHSSEADFAKEYQSMSDAYQAIFTRLGLDAHRVESDNGYIGGEYCHEYIVDTEAGESDYLVDQSGSYQAHQDVAVFDKSYDYSGPKPEKISSGSEPQQLKLVEAKRGKTMADGVEFHQLSLINHIKNVAYKTGKNRLVLACIRADLDVNEVKLAHQVDVSQIEPLTDQEVIERLGSYPGFISPVDIRDNLPEDEDLTVVIDDSVVKMVNAASGSNQDNFDYLGINYQRDFIADKVADIALAQPGYIAVSGGPLEGKKGVEVGNIFQLGYHYSSLMDNANYTDQNGDRKPYYMGCYGIGVGRTIATIVELDHDEKGIIWPEVVAPYRYHLISLARSVEEPAYTKAEELYQSMTSQGLEVLWDDRLDIRAGEKFADADLIGNPIRLVISAKTLASDQVELKHRDQDRVELVGFDQIG
ncbi:proline--tRNA ligase [Candidatus Saccharibacteria bacterium]|nr:proline--tRNA ligase [Candidatus Saccharibacteria bacterium]MCB9834450.1 proline--tRNA ligase [Candidatus Nomurabacteria bacterium]